MISFPPKIEGCVMILALTNILKDMRKHKPMHYKPKKQNSIEKAKKKKKIFEKIKTFTYN